MEFILAVIAGVVLAIGFGWLAWARPASALRAERDAARTDADAQRSEAARQREERGRHAVEVRMLQDRLSELSGAEAQRETLATHVAALTAGQAERDRAHAADLARTAEQFEILAAKALDGAQAKMAETAEALLTRHRDAAGVGLEANRVQLAELIAPMRDTLGKYEQHLGAIEKVRSEGYHQLTQLLDQVAKGQDRVSGATAKLETVLRSSGKAAGSWGEDRCRNVLELAGLVDGVDFVEQTSAVSDDNRRPDFIISLPGNRKLVIDVKCSVEAYMSASECQSDQDRLQYLRQHAKAVRTHANALAKKEYEKSVIGAVDFVVLFVPGENFLSAAFEHDRTLMQDFMSRRLVLAGPINLIAVANTVAAMRDQARLAKHAEEIRNLGRELYDSLRIMAGNVGAVQKGLEGAVTSWNKLVGQLDSRVMLRARRFEQLGATTGLEAIPDLKAIEAVPMLSSAAELLPPAAQAVA